MYDLNDDNRAFTMYQASSKTFSHINPDKNPVKYSRIMDLDTVGS